MKRCENIIDRGDSSRIQRTKNTPCKRQTAKRALLSSLSSVVNKMIVRDWKGVLCLGVRFNRTRRVWALMKKALTVLILAPI